MSKRFLSREEFSVGEIVILYSRENILKGGGEKFYCKRLSEHPNGLGGNMNPNICRFHGWRGTTNDIEVYAYGVREVQECSDSGREDQSGWPLYWIKVSEDLHPDWD